MHQSNTLRYSILGHIVNRPYIVYNYIFNNAPFPKSEESMAYRFGSAVDCLLTTDEFWKKYAIGTGKTPPPMMLNYINRLIETSDSLDAYKFSRYKISIDKVEKNFEEYREYYEAKKNNITLLSEDEFKNIEETVSKIDRSPFKTLFTNKDNLHQLEIKFNYKGFICSGTLDILEVDNVNKTLRVIDLKTTKDITTFEDSYYMYKYYRQVTYYTKGIELCIEDSNNELFKYNGSTVLEPAFLVVDRVLPYPLLYSVNEKYRGIDEIDNLLDLFQWHIDNKVFINKVHYENNYIIKIL